MSALLAAASPLLAGLFLGWTLGANHAANVFGTAVGSRIISYRTAIIICAVMVMLGATLQGAAGISTLRGISEQTVFTAVVVTVATALTGTLMTLLSLPVSTSQALVGAIIGMGLATGRADFAGLGKIVLCWAATPFVSMLVAMLCYKMMAFLLRHIPMGILTRDKLLWAGLILVGAYGSYALGANNVANTTGVFSGIAGGLSDRWLAFIGGAAIAAGVLTFSRNVMTSVGGGIMRLDAFSAFAAVFAMALTLHVFAVLGVPISTSQDIVGAIFGIGLVRGVRHLHFDVLRSIVYGWVVCPLVALLLSAAGYAIFHRI